MSLARERELACAVTLAFNFKIWTRKDTGCIIKLVQYKMIKYIQCMI